MLRTVARASVVCAVAVALLPACNPVVSKEVAAEPEAGEAVAQPQETEVAWVDAESGETIFTSDDIVAFDWEQQVFHLQLEPALDFVAWQKGQYRRFAVTDKQGVIYQGQWVSPLCSMGFSGPTITFPFSGIKVFPPRFHIHRGYPGEYGDEKRFAPRLREALARAGKLHPIDLDSEISPIERVTTDWVGTKEGLKVRVEYFPQTFRIGKQARAHFFFAPADTFSVEADELAIEFVLVEHTGRFRSETIVAGIPLDVIRDGVYVCRFSPWEPMQGCLDTAPQPGSGGAHLMSSVLIRKMNGGKWDTVTRWDLYPCRVTIH